MTVPSTWTIASVHQFAECLDRLRVPIKRDQRQSELGLYPYYGANGEVGRIDQFIFDDELVLVTEDETFLPPHLPWRWLEVDFGHRHGKVFPTSHKR